MKKILKLIVLISVISGLVACGNEEQDKIIVNGHSEANGIIGSSSEMVALDNGYYVVTGKPASNSYIIYFDKNTNQETVMCSKINCAHTIDNVPKDCDAYIGNILSGSLKYYDGYLYYIEYDVHTYECILWRISIGGQEREKIHTLGNAPNNYSGYYNYVVTDMYVIYSDGIVDITSKPNEKNVATLKAYNIKDKKEKVLLSYEDIGAEIFDLRITDDSLYYRQQNIDGPFETKLYQYKFENGNVQQIGEKVCSYTIKNEEMLAYFKAYDGVYEYNSANASTDCIYTSDDDSKLGFIASAGGEYYIFNINNMDYNRESALFIGKLKGGIIEEKLNTRDAEGHYYYVYLVDKDGILYSKIIDNQRYICYWKIVNGKIENDSITIKSIY